MSEPPSRKRPSGQSSDRQESTSSRPRPNPPHTESSRGRGSGRGSSSSASRGRGSSVGHQGVPQSTHQPAPPPLPPPHPAASPAPSASASQPELPRSVRNAPPDQRAAIRKRQNIEVSFNPLCFHWRTFNIRFNSCSCGHPATPTHSTITLTGTWPIY